MSMKDLLTEIQERYGVWLPEDQKSSTILHGAFWDLCPRCQTKVLTKKQSPFTILKGWLCSGCGKRSKNLRIVGMREERT